MFDNKHDCYWCRIRDSNRFMLVCQLVIVVTLITQGCHGFFDFTCLNHIGMRACISIFGILFALVICFCKTFCNWFIYICVCYVCLYAYSA